MDTSEFIEKQFNWKDMLDQQKNGNENEKRRVNELMDTIHPEFKEITICLPRFIWHYLGITGDAQMVRRMIEECVLSHMLRQDMQEANRIISIYVLKKERRKINNGTEHRTS